MSKSPTITNPDWLHNSHAGEMLWLEFLEPMGLTTSVLAQGLAYDPKRLDAVISGSASMDAELDLRLARYFGMSEGFFLGLQADYELLEAKRALGSDLELVRRYAA